MKKLEDWKKFGKEACDRCGNFKWVDFIVKDDIWKRIIGDINDGVFCLNCFIELVNIKDEIVEKNDFVSICFYNPYTEDKMYSVELLLGEK